MLLKFTYEKKVNVEKYNFGFQIRNKLHRLYIFSKKKSKRKRNEKDERD